MNKTQHAMYVKSELDLQVGGMHSDMLGIMEQYDTENPEELRMAIKKAIWIGYCRGFEDGKDFS